VKPLPPPKCYILFARNKLFAPTVAVVTPQHTGYRVWVKALTRQQRIKIHTKRQIIILRKAKLFKVQEFEVQNSKNKNKKCCKKLLLKRQKILRRNKQYKIDFCQQLRYIPEKESLIRTQLVFE